MNRFGSTRRGEGKIRVEGSGFRVQGVGFRVERLGLKVRVFFSGFGGVYSAGNHRSTLSSFMTSTMAVEV